MAGVVASGRLSINLTKPPNSISPSPHAVFSHLFYTYPEFFINHLASTPEAVLFAYYNHRQRYQDDPESVTDTVDISVVRSFAIHDNIYYTGRGFQNLGSFYSHYGHLEADDDLRVSLYTPNTVIFARI